MARIGPFEKYPNRYENWFHKHKFAYRSELACVKRIIPLNGRGIEIGVGSGRFAGPLGIKIGVEPSQKMVRLAVKRGLRVIQGIAETLPIGDERFDFSLIVTTICFLDNIEKAFREIYRILKTPGCIIVGFVDKQSLIGQYYREHKEKNVFYREANFFSVNETVFYLKQAGFGDFSFYQTIYQPLQDIKTAEVVKNGYGKGSFVVIKGEK